MINEPTIFDFFKDTPPTQDQNDALHKIDAFLHSDAQIFILKGYAGSGKTTILKGLSEYLIKIYRMGHIMAPTGRAAKVIEDKTKYPATTIHRAIYNLGDIQTYKTIGKDGNETFKFYFGLRENSFDLNKVFIIDESSMISNVFSEGEFFRFGSGYLLNDILKYFDLNGNKKAKLIFVGDPAQLPPVGSNNSDALDVSFFKNLELSCSSIEMTEVIRQHKDSGILENAGYYRNLIFSNHVAENILNTHYDDINEIEVADLADTFTSIAPLPDISRCIIIAHTNKTTLDYNKIIRAQYFPGSNEIVAGDILQIIKNNYSNQAIEFFNGDFVKVIDVTDETESRSVIIKKKDKKDVIIKHVFREVTVQHSSGQIARVKILDSLLNNQNRDLSSDEMKALYIDFIIRYEKKHGAPADRKSIEFKKTFQKDPYFNALQVKYGYAITGHKSQGGEWENVFIDFTGRIGTSNDVLRWNYTALTRASKKLVVLYPPKLEQIDFSTINLSIGKIHNLPANAQKLPDVEATPYHTLLSLPAKRHKFFQIKKITENLNYSIQTVISHDYLEKYAINTGKAVYIINMHHKADGTFTSFSSNIKNDESEHLLILISQPPVFENHFVYETKDLFLEKLYNKVLSAMQNLDISFLNIDDSKKINYYVNYYLRTSAEGAYLQIFFNKNEKVTGLIARSMLGEADLLLKNLLEKLKTQN